MLRTVAKQTCRELKLPYKGVIKLSDTNPAYYECAARCFESGRIEIRLKSFVNDRYYCPGTLLKTLAHEIAHIGHVTGERDHDENFRKRYKNVLKHMRKHYAEMP